MKNKYESLFDINEVNANGSTALMLAARAGLTGRCRELLNKMSPKMINAVDNVGNTALMIAAQGGFTEICKVLIDKMNPEAINAVNKHGYTTLMRAVFGDSKKVCNILVERMSPEVINAINNKGETALTIAIYCGRLDMCEILVGRMVPDAVNAVDHDGNTPLDYLNRTRYEKLQVNHNFAAKLIFMMPPGKVISICGKSEWLDLAKAKVKTLADFLTHAFANPFEPKVECSDFYKFKLFQKVNKELFKSFFESQIKAENIINEVNNYIIENFLTIIGCAKHFSDELLPKECLTHIVSFLGPYSLLYTGAYLGAPAKKTTTPCLAGEKADHNDCADFND